ncbi:MAG TPA: RNA polymerase sigma factor [Polyangiaceae bacterium]|jgi:RNA polymerase sigma-70 factor (ECF subfamily)
MTLALAPLMMATVPRLRLVGEATARGADDAALVGGALRGNRSSEEAIYRAYAPAVLTLTTRLLGRRSDGEDATQDTFILAFQNMHQLRSPAALRPWLMRIAVSQVRRRFRKRRLLRTLGLYVGADDATLESLVSSGASAEVRTDLAALDRVLGTLPANQRIAWMLRYVEGEQLEDVAQACGCSLATAKRRIAAADAQVHAEVRVGEIEEP